MMTLCPTLLLSQGSCALGLGAGAWLPHTGPLRWGNSESWALGKTRMGSPQSLRVHGELCGPQGRLD